MACTPRCMSFYGKTPIYAPKGQVYGWCAPQGAWVCTAKQPSMHEIGEFMDGVQPKVHEFSPPNTHLCTKRASLWMVCTARCMSFYPKTPIKAPTP